MDVPPFNSFFVFASEFKFVYFYVVIMLMKAVLCIPVLALPSDSVAQLGVVMIIQCIFTVAVFSTSPFLVDVCDYIMQVGQFYVLFSLSSEHPTMSIPLGRRRGTREPGRTTKRTCR